MSAPSPVADVPAALRACRSRDYVEEGIPMFLTLEDGAGDAGPPTPNGSLADLAAHYRERLGGATTSAAAAQEVLAAHHFDPVRDEDASLLRVVNFHSTPHYRREEYGRQILGLGERFDPLDERGLRARISGDSGSARPPVLPILYEGYRNNYEVALPLIEEAGLRAWLFVITGFIDAPVEEQHSFARSRYVGLSREEGPGERLAMTWDELRDVVARGHVIACHTATHRPAHSISTPGDAQREVLGPRARLEDQLGVEADALAFLLGAAYGEYPEADDAVRRAGHGLVFSNAKIQRISEPSGL